MGGHKPKATVPASGMKLRFQLIAWAVVFLGSGIFRLSRGVLLVVNWQAMPVYSGAVIGIGVALVLVALIPFFWIEVIFRWLDSDRHRKDIPQCRTARHHK